MRSVCGVCKRKFIPEYEGMSLHLNFAGDDIDFCSPMCMLKWMKSRF
jgi:hypothetical protein